MFCFLAFFPSYSQSMDKIFLPKTFVGFTIIRTNRTR